MGIFDAIELTLGKLPVLDAFKDISPLMEIIPPKETLCLGYLFPRELESYKTKIAEETGENELEWEGDDADKDFDIRDEHNYDVRKAFDVLR